jgi:hypothetical protein
VGDRLELANGTLLAGHVELGDHVVTGGGAAVAPDGSDATNTIAIDSAEWALTPALGLMSVSLDNPSGPDQAQLIKVNVK